MTERNYWVLCDDNCRFPAMTKEQIYDAIAEATGMTPTPVDEAFITMIKEQNANHNMKFWHGTEAQFNALEETDPDTVYVIGTNKVKSVDALEAAVSELQEEVQPVERGGTGATTAAQARTNLGLHGAETRTLLWTNASPSSAFGAQAITLDLSGGKYIEIASVIHLQELVCDVIQRFVIDDCIAKNGNIIAHADRFLWRGFRVSSNKDSIAFERANYLTTYGNWVGAAIDSVCVPHKIWVVKEV